MAEAVANMIFDDGGPSTNGHAFDTPECWFVDDRNRRGSKSRRE